MARIHIAGFPVRVGNQQRQRCAWCGEILIDDDLANMAVFPADAPIDGSRFEANALIAIEDGNPRVTYIVRHVDGSPLPAGWCGDERPALKVVR